MSKSKKIKHSLKPLDLKKYILNSKEPFVIHGFYKSWDIVNWSLQKWSQELGEQKLKFRVGLKMCQKTPQWESTCKSIYSTFEEFIRKADEIKDEWVYFDYKYMHEHFSQDSPILQGISWTDLGFEGQGGKDSTIWIGSEGANTPCHMDTYGCNVVAQVYGRKTWIMFPPKYTSILKPTRVPYEESSIYSEINFQCGTSELPNMEDIYTTELEPGDVLIVPRHWWHYVENTTIAISINMWVPLPHDDNSRLEEALVRYFITSIVKHIPSDDYCNILNPNEIDLPSEVNDIQQINWCIKKCQESNNGKVNLPNNTEKLPMEISVVSKISFDMFKENQLRRCNCDKQERRKKDYVSMHDVINAYCHPEVISKIKQVLLEQMEPN